MMNDIAERGGLDEQDFGHGGIGACKFAGSYTPALALSPGVHGTTMSPNRRKSTKSAIARRCRVARAITPNPDEIT
jgi:hypothetical protein